MFSELVRLLSLVHVNDIVFEGATDMDLVGASRVLELVSDSESVAR